MKNDTNIIKYRWLAPIYDLIFNDFYRPARRRIFALLDLQPGQKVLLVGVGTGLDLPFVPERVEVTGIDLSADMLSKAQSKADPQTQLLVMNAECLGFPSDHFDVVIMNLILSVVENPRLAMGEAVRVLKPGGKILVFDKFLKPGKKAGWSRRFINLFSSLIGTDITRSLEDIIKGVQVITLQREDSIVGGAYQIILLQKQ